MNLLLLTVGTGTAGKDSYLAMGLSTAIRQADPFRFSLAPSAAEASLKIAEEIRKEHPDRFDPASPTEPFWVLQNPDDILQCRADLRAAIRALRGRLPKGGRLVVNPTSGTKQMSAAAVLAALDEEIGELVFTVGERADGVVKTGTERPAAFTTEGFFQERDLATARALFAAGAFRAVEHLLARQSSSDAGTLRARAACAREWHRQHFAAATRAAESFDPSLATHLRRLHAEAEQNPCSPEILADLLAGAEDLLKRWHEPEDALGRLYKSLEYAARMRLAAILNQRPPFTGARLRALPSLYPETRDSIREHGGTTTPGLQLSLKILAEGRDPLGLRYFEDGRLRQLMQRRNEQVHDIDFVQPEEAASACDRILNLFTAALPDLPLAQARGRRKALANG